MVIFLIVPFLVLAMVQPKGQQFFLEQVIALLAVLIMRKGQRIGVHHDLPRSRAGRAGCSQ